MKRIVATRLALIIGTTMIVISLLNFLIQRDDVIKNFKDDGRFVIEQIDAVLQKNEQEIVIKSEVRYLLSRMPVSDGMVYYVVDKADMVIVGSTDESLLTKPIIDLVGGWKTGEVLQSFGDGVKKCFYFEEVGEYVIGVSQLDSVVFANLRSNMGQLFIYLFIAAYVMIWVSMRMLERYVIGDVDKIVAGVEEITDGELETMIDADNTPEMKILSDNINRMAGSLMEQNRKISKVLDAVDMLIAVYEYSSDSNRVMATGKLGAILMMSEEETGELLSNKELFEQKIDQVKQYPVEDFHKVYRLPVETEC
mgnify:CR=1 FL=1